MALNKEIGGYHRARPQWRDNSFYDELRFGIELELEGRYSSSCVVDVLPEHKNGKDSPAPILERDRSLNQKGVEIVFPPIRPSSIKKGVGYVARSFKALEKASNVCVSGRTGMHVNVNTAHLSGDQVSLFAAVIHHCPTALLEKIGGRTLNGFCRQVRRSRIAQYTTFTVGFGHQYAAEVHSNRIECRFPKATTSLKKVQEICAFLESVYKFVQHCDNIDVESRASKAWESYKLWMYTTNNPFLEVIDAFYKKSTEASNGEAAEAAKQRSAGTSRHAGGVAVAA